MNNRKKAISFMALAILLFLIGGVFLRNSKISNYDTEEIYNSWKKLYIHNLGNDMSRVVNPEDNYITVSEGIGYGLLFSAAMKDKNTFDSLHNYMKSHLNKNGLMNWKIDSKGNVIGEGSATDADEDMAYAFLLAYSNWSDNTYMEEAKRIIGAIEKYEISSKYLVLPGDSWGENYSINPSYIAPLYYCKFSEASNKKFWNNVLNNNIIFLSDCMDTKTGFFPDWINSDFTKNEGNDIFGYDAVRIPIRLLQYYKKTKDTRALNILQTEYKFISSIGADNLTAGYSLSGKQLVKYVNQTYLSSFSAICYVNQSNDFSRQVTEKLIKSKENDYYGSSLRLWTMLILDGKM
ncbi:MAG: glycosyl hydrolase family 8 [Solirubrobacterales bacterium]